jgi:large subunit ribosomal protein L13
LATRIALLLQGKDNIKRVDYLDCGDNVIVINANKMILTGKKLKGKIYYRHSQYPGGLKQRTAHTMLQNYSTQMLYLAVKRMLKKSSLGREQIKKLFIYSNSDHKHEAQKPILLENISYQFNNNVTKLKEERTK